MAGRRLPLLLAAGCALGLAGCSGTPFGDQLSRSFSGAATSTQAPALGNKPDGEKPQANNEPTNSQAKPGQAKPGQAKTPPSPSPQARSPVVEAKPVRLPRPPAPADYRVTIKLPSVDPSAPAEALTKALRSAGLSFEVETIERVRPGAPGQGATVTPAPAPR